MNALQRISGGATAAVAALLIAAPAYADGMRGSVKDAPEKPRCTFSANTALTTDYVFRGFSQTSGDPAIQGGFDATCGMFYAGVWASSLNWEGAALAGAPEAHIEMDWYAGVKVTTGKIAWDLGVIYYSYPGHENLGPDPNYLELKIGASAEIWKGGTLGGTFYYSPDYQLESGSVYTLEGTFSQALPAIGRFTPTFSALIGYQAAISDKGTYTANVTDDKDHYMYWNAGVTFAFAEKWSVDVRYWDTNISNGAACTTDKLFACDERVVGTLKYQF